MSAWVGSVFPCLDGIIPSPLGSWGRCWGLGMVAYHGDGYHGTRVLAQTCGHHYLRELFYDRNPGDARVKVESDWEAASSPGGANMGVDKILGFDDLFCAGGPSKFGRVLRELTPKNFPISR